MSIQACLDALKAGRVVAFPTDTFFALSCDPYSDRALSLLRRQKEIAAERPLPLLIPSNFDCERIGCPLSEKAQALAREFWPGKLTLVVPCHGTLGQRVGRRPDFAVGLRVPAGVWLQELLRAFDGPLVGTSANRTGEPPASTVGGVRRYFAAGSVRAFAGVAPGGTPSTVMSLTGAEPEIEREGAIPAALVLSVWQQAKVT